MVVWVPFGERADLKSWIVMPGFNLRAAQVQIACCPNLHLRPVVFLL
jgi:hypothetical protein